MRPSTALSTIDMALLLVGDPGSRKTTLLLEFPNPWIFDCDCNMAAPLERLAKTNPALRETIFYDRADVDDQDKEILPPLRYQHFIKSLGIALADPRIKTLAIDSLTSFSDILISECKRQGGLPETGTMRIQDWGNFAYLLKHVVTKLRSSGKLVVFTGHNRVEKDESDGRWKYFLNIPGQSATLLSGLFTDVWNPYPVITGIGAAQTHTWKIRCLPSSDVDHRGIKSSLGLKVTETYDDVIKIVRNLKTKLQP